MGWTLRQLGGGYGRLDGVVYTTFVVITDDVTFAPRDEYLRQWMRETKMKQPDIEELPGFEELFQTSIEKTVKKTLEAMPLEQRLAKKE